jgi:hypothetical protein
MTREDLPRLSDADREALPDHAVIAGTVQGEPARVIKFTPQSNPWSGQQHDDLPHMFYLDIHADVSGEDCGSITGYVTRDVERLVMAAPDLVCGLEDAADMFCEIAKECAYCDYGAGATGESSDGGTCEECAPTREAERRARAAITLAGKQS